MARSRYSLPMVFTGTALLLLAGVGIWLGLIGVKRVPSVPPEKLIEWRNLGLAHLENHESAPAAAIFRQLTAELPDDPLGPRNLVIASLLQLAALDRQADGEAYQRAVADGRLAWQQLSAVEPEAAETAILRAHLETAAEQPAAAQAAWEKAATLAPTDPVLPFALYQTLKSSSDPQSAEKAAAALATTHRLAPDNLFVMLDWMLVQAERKDPTIAEVLPRVAAVIGPFAANIEANTRVKPLELLQQAGAAAAQGDWRTVTRLVRIFANVARPEDLTQSDRLEVERHPLEYALHEFSLAFRVGVPVERRTAPPLLPLSFKPSDVAMSNQPSQDLIIADVDRAGSADAILLGDGELALYRDVLNEAGGAVMPAATLALPPGYRRLLFADLDSAVEPAAGGGLPTRATADGDLVLFGPAGLAIVRTDSTAAAVSFAKVDGPPEWSAGPITAAELADLDHDGDLDLVLAHAAKAGAAAAEQFLLSLWSNRGSLEFAKISGQSALPPPGFQPTALRALDWDRDVDIDVLVAGSAADGSPLVGVLENLRHGRFRWSRQTCPLPAAVTSLAVLGAARPGAWEVLAAGPAGVYLIPINPGEPGRATFAEPGRLLADAVEQLQVADVDNDGFSDFLAIVTASAESAARWFRNLGERRFEPMPIPGAELRRLAVGDLDDDGDLDLIATGSAGTRNLRNEGGNANNWLNVVPVAQQVKGQASAASGRVNQHAWGSLLELRTGAAYQAQVIRGLPTHFGLGKVERADALRLLWTNGVPQNVLQPTARTTVYEQQTLKGSCPYLYTWDGQKWAFATDLLWAAPIGLRFANGALAPARPWEYLKLDGRLLQAVDGEYRLRITEELWEAAYFDEVRLAVVDHPAEQAIYTNEKVGPPDLAEPKIYTVAEPQPLAAAHSSDGRDLSSDLAAADDVYARPFAHKRMQGYTDDHFMELDLGRLTAAERAGPITLFLTGWVFPTDTSINVQLAEDPRQPGPRPPYLLVADGGGGWREARPFMGFPGGKTKTIALDLTGLFSSEDCRVRIATSMELYWDAAFFSTEPVIVDGPKAPVATWLPLRAADLRYRGFSARVEHPGDGPERYDYARTATVPRWPAMAGRFTRYGDVKTLLEVSDNRLVVLGSGDEIELRFPAPPPPPPGVARDFILHNVGWDKDADLNTVYGQTVEPLPFQEMTAYPPAADDPLPAGPDYEQYLRTFQTREMPRRGFWQPSPTAGVPR